MTEAIAKVRAIQLPPNVRRELGLSEDWAKQVPVEFIERVVRTAEKHKRLLKELSRL